ncbi:MAG TPA: hypothetical protein PKH69_05495 [Thiobacillaceae bacterium]|nr:hypothetical protein [Thiobacillaceae bacterium]HNU64161.1 hypothetical protein [Thiobacillaceae bacterium]
MNPTAWWRRMRRQWTDLPDLRKNQTAGVGMLLLALVFLAAWWPLHSARGNLAYQLEKQAVRLRQAARAPVKLGAASLPEMKQELALVEARLKDDRTRLAQLEPRFLAYDRAGDLQDLKDRITELARAGDMEFLALDHVLPRADDRDRSPGPEMLAELAKANRYGRPLLRFKARASYRGLMQFLYGLRELPRMAAPVWADIAVRVDSASGGERGGQRQWLELEFRLAI